MDLRADAFSLNWEDPVGVGGGGPAEDEAQLEKEDQGPRDGDAHVIRGARARTVNGTMTA